MASSASSGYRNRQIQELSSTETEYQDRYSDAVLRSTRQQEAFVATLGDSASIILASVVALAVAQHMDVRLFSVLKSRTVGRHRWIRNCGSTAASQGVDTVVFITLGFAIFPALGLGGDPTWGWALLSIVVGQYLIKLLVALVDTVPFYAVTEAVDTKA